MDTRKVRDQLRHIINDVPRPDGHGKIGKQLHKDIVVALKQGTGLRIEKEDKLQFLRRQMPVWRDKNSKGVVPTIKQRKIDIIVYDIDLPVALIEVESDLDDLQQSGVSNRDGHYDVFSIARSADGTHFHSYKSIERMAAAAMYHYLYKRDRLYPTAELALEYLEALHSDDHTDHNPSALPMFLVSGSCKKSEILQRRLKSLNAELICKGSRCHLGGPH